MLQPDQFRALEALLEGVSQGTAAKRAGVTRATVNAWLNHDPDFRDAYNKACDQLHRDNVASIQKAQTLASEKLVNVLKKSKSESNVIRAAIALADLGFKAAEHFRFDERLRKQEERDAAQPGNAAAEGRGEGDHGTESPDDGSTDVVSLPAG